MYKLGWDSYWVVLQCTKDHRLKADVYGGVGLIGLTTLAHSPWASQDYPLHLGVTEAGGGADGLSLSFSIKKCIEFSDGFDWSPA